MSLWPVGAKPERSGAPHRRRKPVVLGVLSGIALLSVSAGHAAPFAAIPVGASVVYSDFSDELRCHLGVTAATADGTPLAKLTADSVGSLVTDQMGTLWASTGCTSGRGMPSPPCALWRAGTAAPTMTAASLKRRLVSLRLIPARERSHGLLCDLHPALGGGVTSQWSAGQRIIRIRVGPTGNFVSARRVPRWLPWPVAQTSDGRLITNAGMDQEENAVASNVAGLGVFMGDVLDAAADGRRLVRIDGDPMMSGGSDSVGLVHPDGRQTNVWSSAEGMIEVREAQFSADGTHVFVRAGTACAFCEGTIYSVDLSLGGGDPGRAIVSSAGRFRVVR